MPTRSPNLVRLAKHAKPIHNFHLCRQRLHVVAFAIQIRKKIEQRPGNTMCGLYPRNHRSGNPKPL